jgi:hypothetical protein
MQSSRYHAWSSKTLRPIGTASANFMMSGAPQRWTAQQQDEYTTATESLFRVTVNVRIANEEK